MLYGPIPKQVMDACEFYIDHLRSKKDELEAQRDILIKTYIRLCDNTLADKTISTEERERHHKEIEMYWNTWAAYKGYEIDNDITMIQNYRAQSAMEYEGGTI